MEKIHIDSIEAAIQDIRKGKMVIVVDDEDRENEGDFVMTAHHVTPEAINFMALHGRGLICTPLTEDRCQDLDLDLMVGKNTEALKTAFTVSVDFLGGGNTTGISAQDRARTVKALIDPHSKPEDFCRPGHIFPLKARDGGVLRRSGHTEAGIDLSRLAGFEPAAVIVEIMNEDGTMARLPDLRKVADRFDLKLITIKDLITYRLQNESLIEREIEIELPTAHGDFHLIAYRQINTGDLNLALVKGTWEEDEPVMVRVHSACLTGDIFNSLYNNTGARLGQALEMVNQAGKGVVLYMMQDQTDQRLMAELVACQLRQDKNAVKKQEKPLVRPMDERDFGVGAQMLRDLGVHKMRLITSHPTRRAGLDGYGLKVEEIIPLPDYDRESKSVLATSELRDS